MSIKWQQVMWGSIILVLLILIGTSIYYLLGGFKEVEVYEVPGEKRNIVGKYFRGYYAHPDLESIWQETQQLLQSGSLTGELVVVNYQNDSLDNDEVEQFIGISLSGGMAEIPAGYDVLEINTSQKLAIYLSMHPLVRPNPITIENMFADYAAGKELSTEPLTIEIHFPDNSMSIETPIQ